MATGIIDNLVIPTRGEFLATPNDALYINQWYSDIINLPEAWDLETGANSNVKIGIIDAVMNWEHEDIGFGPDNYSNIFYNMAENDWANPNDPTSGDGIDNDNNGYIDDYDWLEFPFK
ncbi:MAG: hypothetical protein ACPGU5_00210 [Lishizhenia sp.]